MSAPPADRPSLAAVQQEIVDEMAGLGSLLARYEYVVARGRALEAAPASLRGDEHAVQGCQFRVWMRAELRDGLLHIEADSDALIARGIISLLLRVLDRRPPAEILGGELFFLERTGLGTQLSPSRANGLAAMVETIRRHAAAADGASGPPQRQP
jgi:cysteine desulfuration protein SufE